MTHIWIVSPASAAANNGNWQTAWRWARFLRSHYRVTLAQRWPAADPADVDLTTADAKAPAEASAKTPADTAAPALLIALHARRSAASLANFSSAFPERPSVLLLTGTDLYRDIRSDASARASLERASALVLLQPDGINELAPDLRAKTSVIYQSAPALKPGKVLLRHLDVCMIGHLRAEKDPATFMRAAALVTTPMLRLIHIGGVLDAALGTLATATQAATPRYRWLGPLPHAAARQRLKRCHLMVIASLMEGGANVIIEALTCGVPVLASDIGGNRGMLGDDYAGYFPAGDAATLARLIERSASDPAWLALLRAQCAARAPLFAPQAERAALLQLVDNLLSEHRTT